MFGSWSSLVCGWRCPVMQFRVQIRWRSLTLDWPNSLTTMRMVTEPLVARSDTAFHRQIYWWLLKQIIIISFNWTKICGITFHCSSLMWVMVCNTAICSSFMVAFNFVLVVTALEVFAEVYIMLGRSFSTFSVIWHVYILIICYTYTHWFNSLS